MKGLNEITPELRMVDDVRPFVYLSLFDVAVYLACNLVKFLLLFSFFDVFVHSSCNLVKFLLLFAFHSLMLLCM